MNKKKHIVKLFLLGMVAIFLFSGCGGVEGTASKSSTDSSSDSGTTADTESTAEIDTVSSGISTDDASNSDPILTGDCAYPDDYVATTVEYSELWGHANELGYESLNRSQDGCDHHDVTCLEYPGTVVRSLEGWDAVFGGEQPLLIDLEGNPSVVSDIQEIDWENNTLIVTASGGGGLGSWRMEPRFHYDSQNHLRVTIHIWQPVAPEIEADIGWSSTRILAVESGASIVQLEVRHEAPCTPAPEVDTTSSDTTDTSSAVFHDTTTVKDTDTQMDTDTPSDTEAPPDTEVPTDTEAPIDTDTPWETDSPTEKDTIDTSESTDDTGDDGPVLVGNCSYPDDFSESTVAFSYVFAVANSMVFETVNRNQDGCEHSEVTCLEFPHTVIRSVEGWNAVFGNEQPLLLDSEGNNILDDDLQGTDWDTHTFIVTTAGGGGMGSWRMEPRFHHDNQNRLHVTIHIWQPVVPEVDTDIGWYATVIMRVENGAAPLELDVQYEAPCTAADIEPIVYSYH